MLRSLKEIFGYDIKATDGKFGTAEDFYFDDDKWIIRYLIVDTGSFLSRRLVLISPSSIDEPSWKAGEVPVDLSKKQIENSPKISTDLPISRQHEIQLADYYQWPVYWGVGHTAGTGYVIPKVDAENDLENDEDYDSNLRSSSEVLNYHINANDGNIGHVEDFIMDNDDWVVRYLIVDTSNWMPLAKKVLVSPMWINKIDWQRKIVDVDLKKDTIKNSPEFDPNQPINREYEVKLYDYYGRPKYWI